MIAAAEQQCDRSGIGGSSLCRSVDGSIGGASAEAVAVSTAVLVDWYIGHLVQCSYFSVYLLVCFCVQM